MFRVCLRRFCAAHAGLPSRAWALPLALALLGCGRGESKLRYQTAIVDRGRIAAKVTATGTLSALVTVQVGSQVSGRLQQIFVDFNSEVKRGQVIAKLDPSLFEAAVEQGRANHLAALANLNRARVQAVDAERQLARTRSLAERKLVAQADLDTAQSTADAAKAQVEAAASAVEQARAALHQNEVNLEYATVVSPITGVVISRNVDVGQTVAASFQAPVLFVIAENLGKMQVDTSVAEADIGKLYAGMDTTFTVDAYPDIAFAGKVRQIRNAPTTVQNVVTYDAVIDVENPELKLKPGMTANVTFIYAQRDGVLRVPNTALRFVPPAELLAASPRAAAGAGGRAGGGVDAGSAGGRASGRADVGAANGAVTDARPAGAPPPPPVLGRTVWVLRDEVAKPVRITTGVSDGTLTELASGDLGEGDALVIEVEGGGKGGPAQQRGPRFL